MTTITMKTTTCQICGRPIKSNTGTIAHHGYKRPGQGWQTASCMGAKHLPYEASCDLIPTAIKRAQDFITAATENLEVFKANPPETLSGYTYAGFGREKRIEVARPEDFDPSDRSYGYRPNSYSFLFGRHIAETEAKIAAAKIDIDYLTERLANWKAPAPQS